MNEHDIGIEYLRKVQRASPASKPPPEPAKPIGEALPPLREVRAPPPDSERDQRDAARKMRQAIADIGRQLGARYSLERCGWGEFLAKNDAQRKALAHCSAYRDRLTERVKAGEGIIFYGPVGTGKDHLQASLLYEAARDGLTCLWVSGQDLFGRFRDRMDSGSSEDEEMRRLCHAQILAISDPIPPSGELTDWRLELLCRLIDRRYRGLLATWATINAQNPDDAEAKLSSPVWDRIQETAELVPCFWPSYRERRRN